ncbi:MAG: hypothetical protein RLP15_07200 [Cryomorphaceae bacterium]
MTIPRTSILSILLFMFLTPSNLSAQIDYFLEKIHIRTLINKEDNSSSKVLSNKLYGLLSPILVNGLASNEESPQPVEYERLLADSVYLTRTYYYDGNDSNLTTISYRWAKFRSPSYSKYTPGKYAWHSTSFQSCVSTIIQELTSKYALPDIQPTIRKNGNEYVWDQGGTTYKLQINEVSADRSIRLLVNHVR